MRTLSSRQGKAPPWAGVMTSGRYALVGLGGLAVLVLLYVLFGVHGVIDALRHVHPGLFLGYLGVAVLVCLGYSLRWYVIAGTLGDTPPVSRFVAARLAGDAVGSLMPVGRIGGDPLRVALLYGDGVAGPRASAGVLIDRIVEVIGNCVCAAVYVSVFALTHTVQSSWSLRTIFATVTVPLLALAVLMVRLWRGARPLTELGDALLARRWPRARRWTAVLAQVEDDLSRFFRQRPAMFLGAIGASLLIEGMVLVEYGLLFAAFGVHLDLPTLLIVMVVSGLVRAVPVPAGLGAMEAGQVTLLAAIEGRPDIGLIIGTVLRLHETIWITAGLAALSLRGMSFARLRLLASTGRAAA